MICSGIFFLFPFLLLAAAITTPAAAANTTTTATDIGTTVGPVTSAVSSTRVVAEAVFNIDGVIGSIVFSQMSPTDLTFVNISLAGLNQRAGPYHVHVNPIVDNTMGKYSACLATGGHLNPFGVNYTLSGLCNSSNPASCEVGDLSGKHGYLTNLISITTQYADSGITLFDGDTTSIIGRAIVIHFANSTSRWVCADILTVNVSVIASSPCK